VTVLPCFLAAGRHVREDVPRLVAELRAEHPGATFRLAEPLGADPRVADLLAARVAETEGRTDPAGGEG
jgi:sirohydrochlorin cobaltochelatase